MTFNAKQVREMVKKIPPGKVATYGQIAGMLGSPRAAQLVGWILHSTPENAKVPAQRVVNRFGGLAAGYTFGGPMRQKCELENEGVEFKSSNTVDLTKYLWQPKRFNDDQLS